MKHLENLCRADIEGLIDKWILNERDRKIMKRRLIDGICLEPLAEEFNVSVSQVKRIINKSYIKISKYI